MADLGLAWEGRVAIERNPHTRSGGWGGPAIMLVMAAFLGLTGCGSSALPKSKTTTQSPWETFEEAKTAYDSIEPFQSTADDLKAIGYDPYTSANVRVLSYLDVIERFLPKDSLRMESLDPGLRTCVEAAVDCWAYEISPNVVKSRREGNAFLDVFGFKRTTKTSGWRFSAIVVLMDDIVQYKVWDGTPSIREEKIVTKPLGPLQEMEDVVPQLIVQ